MLSISKKEILYLFLYSAPNALLSLGILYIINNVLTGQLSFLQNSSLFFFFGILLCSYALNVFFQRHIIKLSGYMIYNNEINILEKLKSARLIRLEHLGKERIYGILEDLRSLVFIPYVFTNGLNAAFILLIGLVYFFFISYIAAFTFIFIVSLFIAFYFYKNKEITQIRRESRSLNDQYFQLIRDYIDGYKEIKLSGVRQFNILNTFLFPNRISAREKEIKGSGLFLSVNLLGQYGLYIIVGMVIFIFPRLGLIHAEGVIPFVVIILFISGPINTLVSLQDFYIRVKIADRRIGFFLKELKEPDAKALHTVLPISKKEFKEIRFENVTYSYDNNGFVLPALNLVLKQGEVVFITGGNGSGKSTVINLLTNLYSPLTGKMYINDTVIGSDNQSYRDLIAGIFTDNHLFSHNYENYELKDNNYYNSLLKTMELTDVVFDDNETSARRKFSKGQSKRMSMIFALLEKRPILVLDEWAADQDPHFRKFFYEELLPQLKTEGKTIIAVTHDDAYFKQADRILKFDYGHIAKDIQVHGKTVRDEFVW